MMKPNRKNGLFLSKRQSLAAHFIKTFAALILLIISNLLPAQEQPQWQNHQQLYDIAKAYLGKHTEQQASIKPLHKNNRIPYCLSDITADFPFNNQKILRLRCEQTVSARRPKWSLHLQINLATDRKAWQITKAVKSGDLITAEAITLAQLTTHDFGEYVDADESPVGNYSKINLTAGQWLKNSHLSDNVQVWQAKAHIPAETLIAEDMLALSVVNKRKVSANAITSLDKIVGKTSRRGLAEGHIITAMDLTGRQRVLVAQKNLSPKKIITADDLKLEWRLDTQLRHPGITNKGLVIGKLPRSYIMAGRVITTEQFRKPYVVVKNQTVKLVYKTANLSISSEAKALANGNMADVIEVEVKGSGKLKLGKVVAKGVVELVE